MRAILREISSSCKSGVEQNRTGIVAKQTVIAYWLIPSEPALGFFQQIINNLARRYDAPLFEPHVTIHVGADRDGAASNALREAARQCRLVRLTPLGINQSAEFIKTLFVQFAASPELQNGSEIIREAANDSSHYQLKPHLSLLYKNLPGATRRQLAASIRVPFSDVTFHAIKAVRCVSPTECGADVEAWRIVAQASLSGDRA